MPTVGPYITSGGADVLLPAAAADQVVIHDFLTFGTTSKKSTTTTTSQRDDLDHCRLDNDFQRLNHDDEQR